MIGDLYSLLDPWYYFAGVLAWPYVTYRIAWRMADTSSSDFYDYQDGIQAPNGWAYLMSGIVAACLCCIWWAVAPVMFFHKREIGRIKRVQELEAHNRELERLAQEVERESHA